MSTTNIIRCFDCSFGGSKKAPVILLENQGFDALPLFVELEKQLKSYCSLRLSTFDNAYFVIDFESFVTNDSPLPGIVIPDSFLSLTSSIRIQLNISINTDLNADKGLLDSGAYLYVTSTGDDFDVDSISQASGTLPNRIRLKGEKWGPEGSLIRDSNSWGLELAFENVLPSVPMKAMMNRLMTPEPLAQYCKDHNFSLHIDLTCYGISTPSLSFVVEYDFLLFCHRLQVRNLIVDTML